MPSRAAKLASAVRSSIAPVLTVPRLPTTQNGWKPAVLSDSIASVSGGLGWTPHITPNLHRTRLRSAVDGRTTRHPGYAISQRKVQKVEEIYGWGKTVGLLRKLRHRGTARVGWVFTFTAAVYNLIRIRNLALAGGSP